MRKFIHHLFIPRESNNHRSKLLHHSSIWIVITLLLGLQLFLTSIKTTYPQVLGDAIDITSEQLLVLTNKDREKQNLPALALNGTLSEAARLKAEDMFARNYWAHNAPDGTTPWVFIKKAGYNYTYAGENLARGYTTSSEIVNAWMASPSHRDNMLSPNYVDVGFAVKQGRFQGEDTILVVEMFGNGTAVPPSEVKKEIIRDSQPVEENQPFYNFMTQQVLAAVKNSPVINIRTVTWFITLLLIGLFTSIFIIDSHIVAKKRIVRHTGHNLDHIFFFIALFVFIIIVSRGGIL